MTLKSEKRNIKSAQVTKSMASSSNQFTPECECEVEDATLGRSTTNSSAIMMTRKRNKPQLQVSRKRKLTSGKNSTDPSGSESDTDHMPQNEETSESELDLDEMNQSPACHSAHNLGHKSVGYPSISTVDQWNNDRGFLQHQILLLKSPFEIEECSALLSRQDQRQNRSRRQLGEGYIPSQILQNTLRKLNHRAEDALQKHLTRQAQRKLLNQLQELKRGKSSENTAKQDRPLPLQKVVLLKEAVLNAQHLLSGRKKMLSLASDLCKEARLFDKESFSDDVKKANQLVTQILKRLKSAKKDANSNELSRMEPSKHDLQGSAHPEGYLQRQAVVDKLFSSSSF